MCCTCLCESERWKLKEAVSDVPQGKKRSLSSSESTVKGGQDTMKTVMLFSVESNSVVDFRVCVCSCQYI